MRVIKVVANDGTEFFRRDFERITEFERTLDNKHRGIRSMQFVNMTEEQWQALRELEPA